MPTPPVSKEEVLRRIAAIEDCLKRGFAPPGVPSKGNGALAQAALEMNTGRKVMATPEVRRWKQVYGLEPNWALYVPRATATNGALVLPEQAPAEVRARIALEDQVRDLQAQIKAIHRTELSAENVRETIFNLAGKEATPPHWIVSEPKKHGVTGTPSLLWSDWHWGEVVDPAQVNGANKFDLKIAHERIRNLTERTIDLCFNHMVNPNYPGIVVNLGGDMISGDIHEELSETNELPTMPVLLDLFSKLVWALTELLNRFGRVHVACQFGNHGRNTKKPRMKHRAYSNFDWLLYNTLERHFIAAGAKDITFQIPSSNDTYYRVYGHRYLLTHGDALGSKGGDGVIGALGPILRGDVRIRSSSAHMGMAYDTLLMGHWHQWLPLAPRLIVNGSLKGYDEFAKVALRAPPEAPQQGLWFTHPKWGVTCAWPVRLDDGVRWDSRATTWVSTLKGA